MADLDEDQLAAAVLEYLSRRPEASDSVVGIAEWWLGGQRGSGLIARLDRVLVRLTEQGFLEALGDEPNRCYRLKRR
jgi:hypothetical protein